MTIGCYPRSPSAFPSRGEILSDQEASQGAEGHKQRDGGAQNGAPRPKGRLDEYNHNGHDKIERNPEDPHHDASSPIRKVLSA
mmetsp:Transcript_17592/g.40689  ORF Transcript_17592/g.40689 Transcript_17592/m.40689 type:complete len:83 (-) Transcript_17592:1437-1685(-)